MDINERKNEALLHELARLIEKTEKPEDVLVTISHIKRGAGLDSIKIFVSCLPFEKSQEVMATLEENKLDLKKELSTTLGLRKTPDLIFKIDESGQEAENTQELIKSIKS